MAKKISASAPVAAPVKARKTIAAYEISALSPTRLRARSLLDTRVVYCGDNLESLANPNGVASRLPRNGSTLSG